MSKKIKANIISISVSVLLTFLITVLVLLIIGKNPAEVFIMMFEDVFGSGYGFGQTLFKATPLIICGCGLAICFHASLFNIGAEGQLNAGAFVTALVAFALSNAGFLIAVPAALICGFIVSGALGLVPAVIKVKKGVSEVITTIMMNFIILASINFFLIDFFAVKSTVHTEKIPDGIMISKMSDLLPGFQGSSLNLTFVFAILMAVATYFFIYKTKTGYKIRSVGFNETASRYMGIKTNRIVMLAFFIGSGLTSFVGMNFIMGYKGYYEFGFSNNLGFTAIAVALLAKNNPIGIIFSALLFGFLDYGGLAVNTLVPKEIMFVIQGIVILTILSVDKLVEKYYLK
ncbi:MAG: ABC transporter permease [Ignavibacteriae bacterium]|nr:ABC transporter permease [Ignavibacteriota bacterium]